MRNEPRSHQAARKPAFECGRSHPHTQVGYLTKEIAQEGRGCFCRDNVGQARHISHVMEAPMPTRSVRTTKLDLRLSRQAKQTLLESALSRAEETLVERRHFELSAEQWNAFMAALDAPPREAPRLRRLFQEASPFDAAEPG